MMIGEKELPQKANRVFKLTSAPAVEIVTVDELKTFARIDGSDEDTLLLAFITSVREAIEAYTWRAMIEQSWRMSLDWWPSDVVELPRAPLISLDSVKTIDADGTETTYSSDNYYVVTDAEPGRIVLKNGVETPSNDDRYNSGFRINFTCGYGSTASYVPETIQTAIKLWATAVYETRAMTAEPPPDVKPMLRSYRMVWY